MILFVLMSALSSCSAKPADIHPDTLAPTATASAATGAGGSGSGGAAPGAGGADGKGGLDDHAVSSVGSGIPGDGTGVISGSRLKLVWHVSDDGFASPTAGIHDSLLGFDCVLYGDGKGATKCFPFVSNVGGAFYADDGCTQPAVAVRQCANDPPVPKYASGYTQTSASQYCTSGAAVLYRLSDERMSFGYSNGSAGCERVSYDDYVFVRASEVSSDELATVTTKVD